MSTRLYKSFAVSVSAVGMALAVYSAAQANPLLPVQNLTFSNFTGSFSPKNPFTDVNPVGWTGGTGLIAIDAPGTATGTGTTGNAYAVYGPFADPPPGGNFIQADGNPTFETAFNQVITGLQIGQAYDLSFWQAAGQQQGFSGATTEQWKVFFGSGTFSVVDAANTANNCTNSAASCTTTMSGSIVEKDSLMMNTPSKGVSPWNLVTMTFTADAVSDTLSFLAWGDGGSTANLPPTVFLAGVNTPAQVPEPATLSLFVAGLLGFGLLWFARRKAAV